MAIPTYDRMMRPLLELAAAQDISRRTAEQAMRQHFGLTDEEMAQRNPSGKDTTVHNRSGWAMFHLSKAGLLQAVERSTWRITDEGRAFLRKGSGNITRQSLMAFDRFRAFVETPSDNDGTDQKQAFAVIAADTRTPVELIDASVATLHADVRQRLLDTILVQDPSFFERLVLDVLGAMGYGDVRDGSILHTGKSGDEGIDGRINQDALGLDQVLVQAKRFASEQVVSRKEIQAFIGSLTGQGVTKGVFITTSTFAASAEQFVQRGSPIKVVLIDGHALLDLMMRYKVGVRVERSVEVLDIDQNYFSDE
jgi:restriction system protein